MSVNENTGADMDGCPTTITRTAAITETIIEPLVITLATVQEQFNK